MLTVDSSAQLYPRWNKPAATGKRRTLFNKVVKQKIVAIIVKVNKDKVQGVKSIVSQLNQADRTEHVHHREVFRPWGKYDVIDPGNADKVKRITAKTRSQVIATDASLQSRALGCCCGVGEGDQ